MSFGSRRLAAGIVLLLVICLSAAPAAAQGPFVPGTPEPAVRSFLAEFWSLLGRLFLADTDNRGGIDPNGCPAPADDNRGGIDPDGLLATSTVEVDNRGTIDPNG